MSDDVDIEALMRAVLYEANTSSSGVRSDVLRMQVQFYRMGRMGVIPPQWMSFTRFGEDRNDEAS